MQDNRDDGVPAFPYVIEGGEMSGLHPSFDVGMSVMDWFAGQALTGLLAHSGHKAPAAATYASDAYKIADAMIAQRKSGSG